MKRAPNIDLQSELRFVVEEKDAIDFAGHGMPAVLATPKLVGYLERTARETMAPCLDPDERTVGIELELEHLAPTPLGAKVTCLARVIRVEGRRVAFQVEARDEHELIAKGFHRRAVVRVESFAKRLARKTKP